MSKPSKPSRKHHYVTQAQLRHFARDEGRTQIHVFDKTTGKSFTSSIMDAGSENDFNTITGDGGRLNFEAMYDAVDDAGAAIVAQIAEHRSLSWMGEQQVLALADLRTVQMLRTKLARETPGVLIEEMRDLLDKLGADLNDPHLAPPTDADAKRGSIEAFVKRTNHRNSFLRLMPGLVEPAGSARFLISDHPVVFTNPFPYGDHGIQAQGILVHLPLSPTLLLTWHWLDYVELYDGQRQRRHLGQVKLELLANRGPGWFRAVHFDDSLRALDRHISETSGKKLS
ncbi:DUF4238 domain-containing protein [Mesorhizobium loti]|uniref:Uncharacterized protein n=1 Tax=Rhizobium loti TaxID=381 RepID=A0A1A5IFI3_RHILI|nr:DUF4238 domain-containing protein [Mesorhizobium loti]OBP77994.1 hypothetical protein BAE39_30620 [Mesorhizobium loti]OBQ70033.1 hypothetical protein A8145_28735 [Mesorhizobium loti]QKC73120.1 DUF4238 domain-containing protein [Mesorhizobium loti]